MKAKRNFTALLSQSISEIKKNARKGVFLSVSVYFARMIESFSAKSWISPT